MSETPKKEITVARLKEMIGAGVPCVPARPDEVASMARALIARHLPDSVKALVDAGKGILLHACLADADPRDVDEEDKVLERALRAAIEAVEKEIA